MHRFPDGRRFAFTLVHDADSACSERLEPLFRVFDELGLRITVSAFAFWAEWAAGGARDIRKSVPLCDPAERRFYLELAARGHEIALHTPSDTSSTRKEVIRAFEFFRESFGRYPRVYTEHSCRTKKDAQSNEGSNPGSPYYCRDLLQRYDPWIWIDGPGALRDAEAGEKFFEIPPGVSPINRQASERYGLGKAFVRTGKWSAGGGDGFLECYSEENIDALARDGGIALVYTHLDDGWRDPHTGRMRADIEARLRYLAAKPGWFAPAGEILDCVCAD